MKIINRYYLQLSGNKIVGHATTFSNEEHQGMEVTQATYDKVVELLKNGLVDISLLPSGDIEANYNLERYRNYAITQIKSSLEQKRRMLLPDNILELLCSVMCDKAFLDISEEMCLTECDAEQVKHRILSAVRELNAQKRLHVQAYDRVVVAKTVEELRTCLSVTGETNVL